MNTEKIRTLSKPIRLAGYLERLAGLASLLARDPAQASKFTRDGVSAYEQSLIPWQEAMSSEEKLAVAPIECFLDYLKHSKDPDEEIRLVVHRLKHINK